MVNKFNKLKKKIFFFNYMILHIHNLKPNLSKNNPKKGYNITGNNKEEDSTASGNKATVR